MFSTTNASKAAAFVLFTTSILSYEAAYAEETEFLKCKTIENNDHRLACYDKAAGRSDTAQNKKIQTDQAAPLQSQKAALEKEIAQLKRQKDALDKAEQNRKSAHDINYDGLSATVTKVKKLYDGRLRLYLNNNQIWDQSDSKRVRGIKEGVVVEMKEGVLGAVFIKAEGRKNGGKFRRVK